MTLKAWLAANDITLHDFAKRIGAGNAGTVHKYAHGRRIPRPGYMSAIQRETNGAVTPADFYPDA